ncbi:MAG: conserved phage C-terminal domain-containing protein [Anaerolineales bacterium]
MAKDAYWFRHDAGAGRGTRMRKMQHIYGHWGKGVYWDVIEMLREQDEYKHESDDSSLQMLCDLIGCKDEVKFLNWFKDCIKFELFVEKYGFFMSSVLCENMQKWEQKKASGSEGGKETKRKSSEHSSKRAANLVANTAAKEQDKRIEENRIEDKIRLIIVHLNDVCGSNFLPDTKSNSKHISARIGEGFTVYDLKTVIEHQNTLWGADQKMSKYLRPSTLFNSEKFEGYLNDAKKGVIKMPTNHVPKELRDDSW